MMDACVTTVMTYAAIETIQKRAYAETGKVVGVCCYHKWPCTAMHSRYPLLRVVMSHTWHSLAKVAFNGPWYGTRECYTAVNVDWRPINTHYGGPFSQFRCKATVCHAVLGMHVYMLVLWSPKHGAACVVSSHSFVCVPTTLVPCEVSRATVTIECALLRNYMFSVILSCAWTLQFATPHSSCVLCCHCQYSPPPPGGATSSVHSCHRDSRHSVSHFRSVPLLKWQYLWLRTTKFARMCACCSSP